MKSINTVTAALIAGVLVIGSSSQAPTMASSNVFTLQNGSTPLRAIPYNDRYRFVVSDSRNLRVYSQQWSAESIPHRLSATLRDGNGRLVANSRANGHDFILEQRLAPGRYVLEVQGSRLSGVRHGTHRYYLVTDF
jgi:hypothetical protein